MNEVKKIIKDDINFLEYPNWSVSQRGKAQVLVIEKPHGKYELLSPRGVPVYFDKIVLYWLLHKLFAQPDVNSRLEIITSRSEIAKNVIAHTRKAGKREFDRIMIALKKWQAISINFEGIFYENDNHTIRLFHIIDDVILDKKTKQLLVRLNPQYIRQLQESTFYKLIDFEQYKKLTRAVSARLYEILVKNFKERNQWIVNIGLLGEKLTLEKRKEAKDYYPSDIISKVKPAIAEINDKTELQIEFTFQKKNGCCIFNKTKKLEKKYKPAVTLTEKKSTKRSLINDIELTDAHLECLQYFEGLPADEREYILKEIERHPHIRYFPTLSIKIFAYLASVKQWMPQTQNERSQF